MAELREDILRRCFTSHRDNPVTLASGEPANNKLDLEKIAESLRLRARVAVQVAEMIRQSDCYPKLDLLVAVPNGANWLARDVGFLLGRAALRLNKDPDTKTISYRHSGEKRVNFANNIVIVEDVLNKLTNTSKVIELEGMKEKVIGVFGIWDRSPERTLTLPVPVRAAITEEVPPMLPEDSPLWRYAV